jgi:hypothetical protein
MLASSTWPAASIGVPVMGTTPAKLRRHLALLAKERDRAIIRPTAEPDRAAAGHPPPPGRRPS